MLAHLGQHSHRGGPSHRPWSRLAGRASVAGQHLLQLIPRGDSELVERLVEVVLDRLGANEEPAPDVLIRVPIARHGGDLVLLPRKQVIGLDYTPPRTLAGREKLAAGALGKHPRAHAGKQLMRSSQVFARVEPPPLTAEPFAIQQSGAR